MTSSISVSEKKACLAFLALGIAGMLLLSAVGAELYLRMRAMPQDFFWKHVDLFFASKSPDAAFGNSLIARGFTGTRDIVNLAYPGETPAETQMTVEAYYADKKPGRIILQAGPSMLAEAFQHDDFPRHYDEIFVKGNRRYAPFGLHILDPYYRARLVKYFRDALTPENEDEKSTVFLPTGGIMRGWSISKLKDSAELHAVVRRRVQAQIPMPEFGKSVYAASYAEMVRGLKARGAKVCLVVMPMSAPYLALSNKVPEFQASLAWYESLAKEIGVKYVSYWDSFSDLHFFINFDHLNHAGAEKISPRIIRDCFGRGFSP